MLTRDMIFAADDLPRKEVPVPEWSGSVYVRALTGTERDQLERMIPNGVSTAWLVSLTACDDKCDRLFSEADVEKLASKSSRALLRIANEALKFNALTNEATDDLKNE